MNSEIRLNIVANQIEWAGHSRRFSTEAKLNYQYVPKDLGQSHSIRLLHPVGDRLRHVDFSTYSLLA